MPTQGKKGEMIYSLEEKRELIEKLTVLRQRGHQNLAYESAEFKAIMEQMAEAGMLTECPSGTPLTKENMRSPVGITNIMIRAEKGDDPCILIGIDKNQDRYNEADGIDVTGRRKAVTINHFALAKSVTMKKFIEYSHLKPPTKPHGFWTTLDSVLRFFGGNGLERCREYDRKLQEYEQNIREIPARVGYEVENPETVAQDEPEQVKEEVVAPKANVAPEVNVQAPAANNTEIAVHEALYDDILKRLSGDLSTIMEDVDELDEDDELEYVSKMMACIDCKKMLNDNPPQLKSAKEVADLGQEYLKEGKYKDAVASMRKIGGVNFGFLSVLSSGKPEDIYEVLAGKASKFRKEYELLKDEPKAVTEQKSAEQKSDEQKSDEKKVDEKKAAEEKSDEKKADEKKFDEKKVEKPKKDDEAEFKKLIEDLTQKAQLLKVTQGLIKEHQAAQSEEELQKAMKEAEEVAHLRVHKDTLQGAAKEKEEKELAFKESQAKSRATAPTLTGFDAYFDVLDIKEKIAPLISNELVNRMATGASTPLNKDGGDVNKMTDEQRGALQNELNSKLLGDMKGELPLSDMLDTLVKSDNLLDMLKAKNPVEALTDAFLGQVNALQNGQPTTVPDANVAQNVNEKNNELTTGIPV